MFYFSFLMKMSQFLLSILCVRFERDNVSGILTNDSHTMPEKWEVKSDQEMNGTTVVECRT